MVIHDCIVTMERVREAIAFNAKLVDESTWLWLTSEQMGFPLRPTGGGEHEDRAEDSDSSQRARDHLVAYHLAPAITDFISDENQECCNNDLEQTLTLLHSEWSKEIEPSRQSSTHLQLIVSNPIDEKGSEFMHRFMRWEAPLMAACDPRLLREQETPLEIGKDGLLDQKIPAGSFVRILDSSQVWEEQVDETRIITTESLTTCLDPGRGWTITSGGWNCLKKQECWEGHEQARIATIRKETKRTKELEEAGYRSRTWAVSRALQPINSATRIEGEAAMPALLFFQSSG